MAQREQVPRLRDDSLKDLQRQLRQFAAERAWEPFHTPRNLAALIASEAGELLALYRWGEEAITNHPDDVSRELADVFLGVLRFADVTGIDLLRAGNEKIALNALKYPVERGSESDRG